MPELALRLAGIEALYDPLDPTPPPDRDLAPRIHARIVEWAEDQPDDAPLALRLLVPAAEAGGAPPGQAPLDVSRHFAAEAAAAARRLRQTRRMGGKALIIGVVVLAACLVGAEVLANVTDGLPGIRLAGESLGIIGWVALWRPIELWLYDWWPLRAEERRFERLAAASVTVVAE